MGRLATYPEQFDPHAVIRALDEEHVGFTMLVSAMTLACLTGVPDAAQREYRDLRQIY